MANGVPALGAVARGAGADLLTALTARAGHGTSAPVLTRRGSDPLLAGTPVDLAEALPVAAGSDTSVCVNLLNEDDHCNPSVARGKHDTMHPDGSMQAGASVAPWEAT